MTGSLPCTRLVIPIRSSRFQHEIHMHDVIGKDEQAFVGFLRYPSFQKRMDIAMYGLYISPHIHTTGGLTNRHWTCASHDFKQIPALAGYHLEKKFRGRKANKCPLRFSLERT